MFGLTKLWSAIARLAGALDAMAGTVEEANANARKRLALDEHEHEALPQPEPVTTNGRKRTTTVER